MSGVEPIAKHAVPKKLTLKARRTSASPSTKSVSLRPASFSVPRIKLAARTTALALGAGILALSQTVPTGHLDAAHLLGIDGPGTDRWQTFLMASPAGSIHEATVHVVNDRTIDLAHAGIGQLAGDGIQRAAIGPQLAPPIDPDDIITGSIPSAQLPEGPDPLIARDGRGHRVMTPAVYALLESRRVPTSIYDRHPFERLELASLPTEGFDGYIGLIPPTPEMIIAEQDPDPAVPGQPAPGREEPGSYALALVDPSAGGSPLSETEGQQHISAFLNNDRQFQCLAEGIYFEARGEPRRGQVAVAQVIMNRVNHDEFPDTICGVVYQNQHRRNRCQFSFACDGVPERVTERAAWEVAEGVATQVLEGRDLIETIEESTHYHANYVRPRWAPRMIRLDRVGLHIFYKGRYGGWR